MLLSIALRSIACLFIPFHGWCSIFFLLFLSLFGSFLFIFSPCVTSSPAADDAPLYEIRMERKRESCREEPDVFILRQKDSFVMLSTVSLTSLPDSNEEGRDERSQGMKERGCKVRRDNEVEEKKENSVGEEYASPHPSSSLVLLVTHESILQLSVSDLSFFSCFIPVLLASSSRRFGMKRVVGKKQKEESVFLWLPSSFFLSRPPFFSLNTSSVFLMNTFNRTDRHFQRSYMQTKETGETDEQGRWEREENETKGRADLEESHRNTQWEPNRGVE